MRAREKIGRSGENWVRTPVPRLRVALERLLRAQLADRRRSGDLVGREAFGHRGTRVSAVHAPQVFSWARHFRERSEAEPEKSVRLVRRVIECRLL